MAYQIAPAIEEFRERFVIRHPEFALDEMDWLRCSYALKFVTGQSALEVGPGVGMMIHAMMNQGLDVAAMDLAAHSKSIFPDGFDLEIASITDPALDAKARSTVICMEVIEHLEEQFNTVALANLRKAAAERIIITVPYNEREPLWYADKPGGHRQKFNIDKAAALFPNAFATLLPRYSEEWLFIVEDKTITAPHFTLVAKNQLPEIFGIAV